MKLSRVLCSEVATAKDIFEVGGSVTCAIGNNSSTVITLNETWQ